jgi:ABC-2 type transport system permease protein
MNAARSDTASTGLARSNVVRTFAMLLKREFWENRGGFLWAPLITSGVFLLLGLMGLGLLETATHHPGDSINIDFSRVDVNHLSGSERQQAPAVLNALLYLPVKSALITLAFVVFFYCLGALFDDRKDRSILFWKSLPISDRATVLSKVVTATIVAPVIAGLIGLLLMLVCMVIGSAWLAYHGGHPLTIIWGLASPMHLAGYVMGAIPVYAAWSLPTIGWLMLISVWVRAKPFLWAVMIPVFAGIIVGWFNLMEFFNLQYNWFWHHVVARLLLSAVPGSDLLLRSGGIESMGRLSHGPEAFAALLSLKTAYSSFATADMWIGIAVGALMIFAAIRMRRWSDDS